MGSLIADLQERAVEFAKRGDFGPQALEINLELTRVAPRNEGAWTRLGRCYLESGRLDEAMAALDGALAVDPQNTIARNLQMEVAKRRAGPAVSAVRARAPRTKRAEAASGSSGGAFSRAEFATLAQLPPSSAAEALGGRVDTLLLALNERPFAAKAVETRNRAGRPGVWLFRRGSLQAGAPGHVYAFHYGGRWEPQLNVGFYSVQAWGRNAVRAGIGFNFTPEADDPELDAERERVVIAFERFQRLAGGEWRQLLTQWMTANGGFIQTHDRAPALDLLPAAAVEWLVQCRNAAEVGWIFCGRWLFADKAGDAEILDDGRKLTAWAERTFTDLLPLWATLYRI